MADIFDQIGSTTGDIFDQIAPASVAATATARLAARHLTPDQVKAGGGVVSPDQIKFAPPKQMNGGFFGGAFSNPLPAIGNAMSNAIDAVMGRSQPSSNQERPTPKTEPEIPVANLIFPAQAIQDTAKESYRRGAANQSTSDMYGQLAQTALLAGAGGIKKGYGMLRALPDEAAATKVANVVDPRGINPELAQKLGTEVIRSGQPLKNPQTEIPQIAEQQASGIDTNTPVLNRTIPATTEPITTAIKSAKDALYNEVLNVPIGDSTKGVTIRSLRQRFPDARLVVDGNDISVQQIGHPDMVPMAQRLSKLDRHIRNSSTMTDTETQPLGPPFEDTTISDLRAKYPDGKITIDPNGGWGWDRGDFGDASISFERAPKPGDVGTLSNETLANLHKNYNYYADKAGAFKDAPTDPRRLPPDAHVARAVASVVNEDPVAAAANAEKSQWLDVGDKLPQNAPAAPDIKRDLKHVGIAVATDAAASVVPVWGKVIAGLAGAGGTVYTTGKLIKDIVTSPEFRTSSAIKRAQIGHLLATGDYAGATKAVGLGMAAADTQNAGDQGAHGQAVGAIDHLSNDDLVSVYRGHGAYIAPDGTMTPLPFNQ